MKIKKMKNYKTTKKKWEKKMKDKKPLQCWIVNIMSSSFLIGEFLNIKEILKVNIYSSPVTGFTKKIKTEITSRVLKRR